EGLSNVLQPAPQPEPPDRPPEVRRRLPPHPGEVHRQKTEGPGRPARRLPRTVARQTRVGALWSLVEVFSRGLVVGSETRRWESHLGEQAKGLLSNDPESPPRSYAKERSDGVWRRGWDSNPRSRCRYRSFREGPLQPLASSSRGPNSTLACRAPEPEEVDHQLAALRLQHAGHDREAVVRRHVLDRQHRAHRAPLRLRRARDDAP